MKLTPEERTALGYLHLLGHENAVTEVRILGAAMSWRGQAYRWNGGVTAGYYEPAHYKKLIRDIGPYNGVGNIYTTLNPAHPDLIARADNRLMQKANVATGDDEILRIHWLPIDVDPYRPAAISATDAELAAALQRRDKAVEYLVKILGDGHHITGMSGSGGHGLFRVDLPNDKPSRALIKEIGDGLVRLFSDPREDGPQVYDPPRVGLDNTVYNPSRIWKLPGTVAVKGDSVPRIGRVHRRATVDLRDVTPADLGGLK